MEQKRQPRGNPRGGQFAPSKNPEPPVSLILGGEDYAPDPDRQHRLIQGVPFAIQREESGERATTYTATNLNTGEHRSVQVDRLYRHALVRNIDLERDDTDLDGHIASVVDPDVQIVVSEGADGTRTAQCTRPGHEGAIETNTLRGVTSAQMYLIKGDREKVLAYIEAQKTSIAEVEQWAKDHGVYEKRRGAIEDNKRFIEGMELGLTIGVQPDGGSDGSQS